MNKKLQEELKKTKNIDYSHIDDVQGAEVLTVVSESEEVYLSDVNDEELKIAVIRYKDISLKQLKTGIKANDNIKLQDLLLERTKGVFRYK